jgi:WD40 repeat protein
MRHWDEYTQGKDWVWSVCFSPDGHYLASGGGDKMVRIWAIDVQRLEFHAYYAFSDEAPVRAVAFSPDGYVVACGGVDCGVRRWNLQTGESLPVLAGHTHTVRTIAFNAQGEGLYLASGSQDGTIKFWDLNRGRESQPSLQVSFPYQGMNINNAKGLDEFLRRDLISLGAITN